MLTVGLGAWTAKPAAADTEPPPIGLGNVGTTSELGTYENANGSGERAGLGPPIDIPAWIYPDRADVRGPLDREIIRRVLERHRAELLACWEPAAARPPRVYRRLTIGFTITPAGIVSAAVVRRSTVRDASVRTCFVGAIRHCQFPRPLAAKSVVVSQPFVLYPPRGPSWPEPRRRR